MLLKGHLRRLLPPVDKVPESSSRRVLQKKKRAASAKPLRDKTPKAPKPLPFKPMKPLKNNEPKLVPKSKWKQKAPSKPLKKTKESSQLAAPNPRKVLHLRKNKATQFRNRNQDKH
jgi:hypothetical protein